jgi:hypothetical protein
MDWSVVAVVLGELAFAAFIFWVLIRRGQEKARLRTEMHGRLIERCSSVEDLARFLETESGRRLLEAMSPGRAPSPAWAILATVQGGVVLLVLGLALGYALLAGWVERDFGVAVTVLVGLGVGLLLAGQLSERLSRRYGLLPRAKGGTAPAAARQE